MKCMYCDQNEAEYKCSSCAKKFCALCIEEHFQSKMIPRRSWNKNKILLNETAGEENETGNILGWKRNNK